MTNPIILVRHSRYDFKNNQIFIRAIMSIHHKKSYTSDFKLFDNFTELLCKIIKIVLEMINVNKISIEMKKW
jgi:hypothetical protein